MNNTNKGKIVSFTYETIIIVNCAFNVPLMLISVIGNTLVLAAILRYPSIRSTSMHGFALPFEIFYFSYKNTRRVCLGNNLVVHLSVVSNLSLE